MALGQLINDAKMHKILVSAYGCEPNKGSEPGVGWHWVMEMARTQELWVITRSNNRVSIESCLTEVDRGRIHFVYYDTPDYIKKFKRKEKGLYPYYFLWQIGAYQKAKRLVSEISFDYCMHLTFGSMWMPTFMYRIPLPFIWGPIGGGEKVPFHFIKTLPLRSRFVQYARYILIRSVRLNPFFILPARKAKAIIARTEDSKAIFPPKFLHKVTVCLETGMSEDILKHNQITPYGERPDILKLVCVGRLVALKNMNIAIQAFAEARKKFDNINFTIVGEGPFKKQLVLLAKKLNVYDHIQFLGSVNQEKATSIMREGDIFLFPSLKEGGSWALMEAMAIGLPIICLDTSGMHIITDDNCAIRIKIINSDSVVSEMANAIIKLIESPLLRKEMGENARKRIEDHFMWHHKGKFIEEMFKKLDSEV